MKRLVSSVLVFCLMLAVLSEVRAETVLGDLLRTFQKSSPEEGDHFGRSLAAIGNDVLVGATGDNAGADDSGAVYLFDGETGNMDKVYANPSPNDGDNFGVSVFSSGNSILVGAFLDDTGAVNAGAAHLIDLETGGLQKTFLNPNPGEHEWFGYSVAAAGNSFFVGALKDHDAGNEAGAVHRFDGGTGDFVETILSPSPQAGDHFSRGLALLGDDVLVGVTGDNAGGDNSGAAYLFNGTTSGIAETFLNPSPNDDDNFGVSVTQVGENILIGSFLDDTDAMNAGIAYLLNAETGGVIHTFHNPTPESTDWFGHTVAAVGNNVLISAPYDHSDGNLGGAAYLFDGETGGLLHSFLNPTPASDDLFGYSLAAFGNDILISAHKDDTGAVNAGSVYLFQGQPIPEPSTIILFLTGALGLLAYRIRRK